MNFGELTNKPVSRWTKLNDNFTAETRRKQREKQVKVKVEAKKKTA